jgi:hypothetical protein
MSPFEILTIINTISIGILFYFLFFKYKIEVSETDIIRVISIASSILQIIKSIYNNPNDNRLKFVEELLNTYIKVYEDKYKKRKKKK